jgi:hypothetical protein
MLLIGSGGPGLAQIAAQEFVADLVREFGPLNQGITDQRLRRILLIGANGFLQAV